MYETARLKIDTNELVKFLILIEDREYFRHAGISYKAVLRSFLGTIGKKPKSGGSTITQQLVRTLFIMDLGKKFRRKLMELGLAPWLDKALSKELALQIYLSSVRFERGRYGLVEAMNFFWSKTVLKPSPSQAFFLIERVSNIRSRLLVNKIVDTAKYAQQQGYLSAMDMKDLFQLYVSAVQNKKIIATNEELIKLSSYLEN